VSEVDVPDLDCGGGVTLEYTVVRETVRITTYFDAAGSPVRFVVEGLIVGRFTNSATGETFRDFGVFRLTFDPASGALETVSGLTVRYQVRGRGLEFLEAGRKIFDASGNLVFTTGPKDLETLGLAGIAAVLC
jgi:hypothetical protein